MNEGLGLHEFRASSPFESGEGEYYSSTEKYKRRVVYSCQLRVFFLLPCLRNRF